MLSPDERAGASLKLRVLRADLVTFSAAKSTAQHALFETERVFAQALKSMRDAHRSFEKSLRAADGILREIENTRWAIDVGDHAVLGRVDVDMRARIQALVARDLVESAACRLNTGIKPPVSMSFQSSNSYITPCFSAGIGTNAQPSPPFYDPSLRPGDIQSSLPVTRRQSYGSSSFQPVGLRSSPPVTSHQYKPAKTMVHLPIELLLDIFRTGAELFVELERNRVLSIAVSCQAAYHAVLPVLYHTLIMARGRSQLAAKPKRPVSRNGLPNSSSPNSLHPVPGECQAPSSHLCSPNVIDIL